MIATRVRRGAVAAILTTAVLAVTACSGNAEADDAVQVTGSATVAPVTSAVATRGGFSVNVSAEGTNTGFESFCSGDSVINNASAPITAELAQACADAGVEFVELPIGIDALSMIRNEENTDVADITRDELHDIWAPDSDVTNWSDVRAEWPDEPIGLYGRGDGSGTFDVFTQVINGEAGLIRDDYESTDDLDELAIWIAEDEFGLGFMGVGNYLATDEEDRERITNIDVDGVSPTLGNVQTGAYDIFTRPLFLYVSVDALQDEAVHEFVEYYIDEVEQVLPRVFFYALPADAYPLVKERFDARTTGSMYADAADDANILELLSSN